MYEALRKGASVETLHARTHIKAWFIEQMRELVALEGTLLEHKGRELPDALLAQAKRRASPIATWPSSSMCRRSASASGATCSGLSRLGTPCP